MTRTTVTPLEARCAHCHDTGSLSKWTGGDMDCTHCDTAEKRSAMYATVEAARKEATAEYRLASFDAVWFAYQLGQADSVAAQPALPKLPSTTAEVLDFIGPNFESVEVIQPIEGCPEDFRVTLTGHDLLSAFQAYEDAQPADPDDMAANYDHSTHDERMELLRGMRDEQTAVVAAPVVPEGWRVVPNIPTHEMVRAACDAMGATQSVRMAIENAPMPPFVGALKFDPARLNELILDTMNASFEAGEWEDGDEGETIYQIIARQSAAKDALVHHICSLAAPAIAAPVEVERDAARLDFIEAHPEKQLRCHKKRWALVGFTNYPYEVFGNVRDAIDAAIATGDKHE